MTVLIAAVVRVQSAVPPDADYLSPVDLREYRNYRKILASKLEITQFNCGRSVFLPPFDSESSTSVYWTLKNGQRTYYVTWLSVRESLWQRIDGGHYPARAKSIETDRRDAEIPRETAELVRDACLRMLQGPHGVRPIPPLPGVLSMDSTYLEISIDMPNRSPLYGRLDFSRSFPGKKTKRLANMWNALYEYCKASTEKRPKIASQIERQAEQLLRQLK